MHGCSSTLLHLLYEETVHVTDKVICPKFDTQRGSSDSKSCVALIIVAFLFLVSHLDFEVKLTNLWVKLTMTLFHSL